MKKVLLVLAAIALVTPAFGADVSLWFGNDPEVAGVADVLNYQADAQDGTVTLYMWADNEAGVDIPSIGVDLDFEGDIINPQFSLNNAEYSFFGGGLLQPAWDVTNGANLDDLRWAAVETPGIRDTVLGQDAVPQQPILLGELTFETTGGPSSVEMLVGSLSIGTSTGPATVLFGGGEAEISGDYVANENEGLPQGDGVADAINPIPEPTTMILLGLGALGVIRRRRS